MIPKGTRYPIAYVFEFQSIPKDKDREVSARHALAQIQKKGYDTRAVSLDETQQIRKLAIILQRNKVIVREELQRRVFLDRNRWG